MEQRSTGVLIWWGALTLIAITNIVQWALVVRKKSHQPPANADEARRRKAQLILSGLYVFICAFRSVVPRADVQKICLVDSWISTVFVGRFVATIAEVSFVAQWSIFLRELGEAVDDSLAIALSKIVVPLICVAETCSWYAVLTTNYLGNSLEESTWTVTATLMLVGMLSARRKSTGRLRSLLNSALLLDVGYIAFMCTVDVPMYLTRWRHDLAVGRPFLPIAEGLHVLTTTWVVTFQWSEWRTEIPWMTLYFSIAVWMSIHIFRLAPLKSLKKTQ